MNEGFDVEKNDNELILAKDSEEVTFTKNNNDDRKGVFYLRNKTFNESSSVSERLVYKFLYNNKARFIPKALCIL